MNFDLFLKIFSPVVTVLGWVFGLGAGFSQIKHMKKEIEDLRTQQNNTDELLRDISKTLTSLDTKVSLILDGKLKESK